MSPAIRDFTTRIGTTTTVSACPIPAPDTEPNDLMLAILCTDTNSVTRTWECAGWTPVLNVTNTANLQVSYKYAGAVESDIIFTANAPNLVETVNAIVLSIKDVALTNPFGTPAVTGGYFSQSASAIYMMPVITTNNENTLLIYATANSTVSSVPSIVEGPVSLIVGQDGGAESMSVGWGFKNKVGATANNVKANCVATGTGVNLCLPIVPPDTGATVIPGYCAADLSKLIDPLNGTTAFDSNVSFSRMVPNAFGPVLNNASSSAGIVAALADYGINSFHSVAQLTNAATNNRWYGAYTALALKNFSNVTGKNILVHVMPSTPKQIQTTNVVTKSTSAVGIAFGMSSGVPRTNFRVWHVHGAGTAWGTARTPCVINSNATTGLIQNTGTLNAASVSGFGYFISGTNEAAVVWTFAQLWALDTVTVVGGNTAFPLDITQIVSVGSDGHERMSIIKQGAKQMLVLQPLQIGNGIDDMYLNLDSTAIEFPRQYDKAKKEVYYNSVDNVAGLTYYAASGNTVNHFDSIISSPSKYHWRFHTSSSSAAYYNMSGLSVIGAGDVVLNSNINLTGVTWNGCDRIIHPSNILNSCTFTKSTATNNQGALVISSNSTSTIQGYLDKLVACTFSNNVAPSGALMLEYTGAAGAVSLAFTNNFFSGNKKDIYWKAPNGSNLTLNLTNGANPSTYSVSGTNTVTFASSNTFTITNVAASSEVRVFRNSDSVELCGVENIGSSTPSNCSVTIDPDNAGRYKLTYTHSNTNLPVFIPVVHYDYQVYRQNYTLTNSTQELLVSQIGDRQYFNP